MQVVISDDRIVKEPGKLLRAMMNIDISTNGSRPSVSKRCSNRSVGAVVCHLF
jgi:hypothetical protein